MGTNARRHDEPASKPPFRNWRLICKRRITIGSQIFNCGCEVTPVDLGRNFESFLSSHYVAWCPPSQTISAKPVDLPKPVKAKPRPAIEIIADADPVKSWALTKRRMTKLCDGNSGLADDLLMTDQAARELFKLAQKVWCENERIRRNLKISVTPDKAAMESAA